MVVNRSESRFRIVAWGFCGLADFLFIIVQNRRDFVEGLTMGE